MRTGLVVHSKVTALIALGTAVQHAAAEVIRRLASSNPYYEPTRNVAVSAQQFRPTGTEARDWEPSISKVRSLQDADMSVYNGLNIEGHLDRQAQSGDLFHITFVKAGYGLVLIYTAKMIREVSEE